MSIAVPFVTACVKVLAGLGLITSPICIPPAATVKGFLADVAKSVLLTFIVKFIV